MKSSFKITSLTESYALKSLLLIGLCYLLLFPLHTFEKAIEKRQAHYTSLKEDLRKNWGGQQSLTGPILILPYERHIISINTVTDEMGQSKTLSKDIFTEKTAIIYPEKLIIDGQLDTEYKQSGLNQALVYSAAIKLNGQYNITALTEKCSHNCSILWDKASLSVGLKDTKTILNISNIQWDNQRLKLLPGSLLENLIGNGFHANINGIKPRRNTIAFQLDLIITGSNQFNITPIGEVTKLKLTTNWTTPEFIGGILPKEIIENKAGFTAVWEIPSLARNYPQQHSIDINNISDTERAAIESLQIGIQLDNTIDRYSNTLKLSQYALLFPILTFLCLFIVEINSKSKISLSHYLLTGLLLGIFYLLLAALAEHREYFEAYIISATTITLITFFTTWLSLKRLLPSLLLLILLAGLYSVFYSLLYFPDYSLLAAAGLFVSLTTLLLISNRKSGHHY